MEVQSRKPALLLRLRPTGPWRIGGETGKADDVSAVFPSDRLFSAITQAVLRLGGLDAWLEATVNAARPAVRFTSLFPFFGRQLYVPPPITVWPPAMASARMNWHAARLVPVSVVEELLRGESLREDRWEVDGISGCLLPAGAQSPFRRRLRATAPVDRLRGASAEAIFQGCLEFNQGAGLWGAIVFENEEVLAQWEQPVRSALNLLADTGFGGERTRGWGQADTPEFQRGSWPGILLEKPSQPEDGACGYWLLSTFVPGSSDQIDWRSGNYQLLRRHGRIESWAAWGTAKQTVNMVREGGILVAAKAPVGCAVNVAPPDFPHPVWRAGFAVALELPWKQPSYQLPLAPSRQELPRVKEEATAPLANIYLMDPIIVEEANIVEEAQVVEQPRYVEEEEAP